MHPCKPNSYDSFDDHAILHCTSASHVLQASDINALFGFRLECTERLGEQQGIWAWKRLNSLFNWLPLAATIEDRVLCMHGGNALLHTYKACILYIHRLINLPG